MQTYLALIQLGQRQHQSPRYWVLSFKEIATSTGWSDEKEIAKFYNKPVQEDFSKYLFR